MACCCILIAICCSCCSFNPVKRKAWVSYTDENVITDVVFYKKNVDSGFRIEMDEAEMAIGQVKNGNKHGKWMYFRKGSLTMVEIYKKGKMIERRRFNTANMW